MLVGTSLVVIIPEGVETLYSANDVALHARAKRELYSGGGEVQWAADAHKAPRLLHEQTDQVRCLWPSSELSECGPQREPISKRAKVDEISEVEAINALPGPVIPGAVGGASTSSKDDPPKTPTKPGEVAALDAAGDSTAEPAADNPAHADSGAHHAWMGISLISGFILMYLIDTLPSLRSAPPPQRGNIYSLSDLSATASSPSSSSPSIPRNSFSTTLGLVIHAAADGIALGASSSQPSLSFIIFFAIMVHKAPAAFGLTSVLLKQGLGKRQARTHLVAFSLAAPCGAILTWLLVGLLGGGGEGVDAARTMKWWTGIILLFSGGTFL